MLTLHLQLEASRHDGDVDSLAWVLRSEDSGSSAVEYPSRDEAELDATAVIREAVERGQPAQLVIHHPDGATTQFKTGGRSGEQGDGAGRHKPCAAAGERRSS